MKGNELNAVTLGIQIDVLDSIQRIHFATFRIRIEIIAINSSFAQWKLLYTKRKCRWRY